MKKTISVTILGSLMLGLMTPAFAEDKLPKGKICNDDCKECPHDKDKKVPCDCPKCPDGK